MDSSRLVGNIYSDTVVIAERPLVTLQALFFVAPWFVDWKEIWTKFNYLYAFNNPSAFQQGPL